MARSELKHVYDLFLRAVMSALYNFDPDRMGRSIDAPPDEYRDLATRLLGPLWRSATPSAAATEIRKLVPATEPDLIKALWAARQNLKLDWSGSEGRDS